MNQFSTVGPDPRALRVAQGVFACADADDVILFGSRARDRWTRGSDLDLLVVNARPDSLDQIRENAFRLVTHEFGVDSPLVDLIFLTRAQYEGQVRHSINGIAAVSHREGVHMAYPPPLPRDEEPPGTEPDPELTEYGELTRRLSDANQYYAMMHILLDRGMETGGVANQAHRVLEHAFKALISAQGGAYAPTHDLRRLRNRARVSEDEVTSDLVQLNQYAGGGLYGTPDNPVADFTSMANAVTKDLKFIYRRIERIIQENPWSFQLPGQPEDVRPIYRQG